MNQFRDLPRSKDFISSQVVIWERTWLWMEAKRAPRFSQETFAFHDSRSHWSRLFDHVLLGFLWRLVPGCRAFKNPEAESLKARPALRTCSNKPGFSNVRTQVATACSSCHKIDMCLRTNAKTNMAARSPRRGQKESIFQDVEPVQTDHRSVD